MRARTKVGLVAAGYVAALVAAVATVAVYAAVMDSPERQASSGMSAFGDSLLFLAVFGVASVPATAAGLFLLRPYPGFWRALALAAFVIAATGVAAVVVCVADWAPGAGPTLHSWSALAVLRVLVAPLLALAFLVSGVLAPGLSARVVLGAACVSEGLSFAYWLLRLPR